MFEHFRNKCLGLLALVALAIAPMAQARTCGTPPPPDCPGALYACPMEGETAATYCPLEHTDVKAAISGDIARVTVTQRFRNPLNVAVEAIYTFPLSEKGAVDRMTMKIGDRVIVGTVKEREEARAAYEAARSQGQTAALLDQERPNIFTQQVANVQPGDVIEVTISYVEFLAHTGGEYTFAFPMTVGPRYTGGTAATPDSSRITPPIAGEGRRAGHDISLEVLVDAGLPLGAVTSTLHAVDTERPSESRAIVRLRKENEIPNRDFVLNYSVSGEGIREGVLVHRGEQGGFFTLWLQPPAAVDDDAAVAKELIFVIDSSGSMRGFPLAKAQATMRQCIEDLGRRDVFNLISFAGGTGYCFPSTVPATQENKARALAYLDALEGNGGTEMMGAINAALAGPYTPGRLRTVCFMTDGEIGNDMEIFEAIQRSNANARVFSFGIGNSVNRFLIEGMAREGRGAAEIVTLESNGDAAVARFRERIKRPVLTDITVEADGMNVEFSQDKERLADLFAGQPVRITGRVQGRSNGTITVRGNTVAGPWERRVDVRIPSDAREHDALASLWARERVEGLMAEDWQGIEEGAPKQKLKKEIIALGVDYSLVTQFTSFIAIDESRRGKDGRPMAVHVPVELADGMSREGLGQLKAFGYGVANSTPAAASAPMVMKRQSIAAAPAPSVAYQSESSPGGAAEAAPVAADSADYDALSGKRSDMAKADAPASPSAMEERKKEAPKPAAPVLSADELSKLDSALQGLREKLVGDAYSADGVRVAQGVVEVAIYLRDLSEATLAQLRALGVNITAQSEASGKVLARIRVDQLEALAQLDVVTRIAPPAK